MTEQSDHTDSDPPIALDQSSANHLCPTDHTRTVLSSSGHFDYTIYIRCAAITRLVDTRRPADDTLPEIGGVRHSGHNLIEHTHIGMDDTQA